MPFNTVNAYDYALIALYFAIVVFVGFYAAKKNRGTDDYFKAGGQVPWVLAGLSNWVSGFSAFMFVAAAGYTYRVGVGSIVVFTMATWAYLLGYFYFAKMWRRARLDSPLQFLTRRYSPSTTYFYSVTAIIPQIVGIGQGLYILCIFVSTALGFGSQTFHFAGLDLSGLQLSIIIVGIVMVLYTVIGGLWAAVLSDAVQSIIIVVMTIIIFPVSYQYLGEGAGILAGFDRMLREVPPEFLTTLQDTSGNVWFLSAYVLSSILGYNVAWHLAQRYYSVPDERGARKMALLCAALSFFGPLLWILPVMAAKVIFPDMRALWPQLKEPAEASYVSLALLLLPHGLIGFVVSAVLSATLGQANDAFNWLAATTTRDVYVPLHKRARGSVPSDRQQLNVARWTMFIVGILGIAVALYIPRFGGAFQFALQYHSLIAGFMMPVALGMVFRRTPWWSGIASCSAAVLTAITLMILGVWPENPFARNVFSEAIAATLVFAASAWWYRADDPRHAELHRLEKDFNTPVPDAPAAAASGLAVYGLIGAISIILGIVLAACTLLPSSPLAPSRHNLVAGLILIAIGVGLRRVASRAGVAPPTQQTTK
jgi:solute:Na+ symporter, SSS family